MAARSKNPNQNAYSELPDIHMNTAKGMTIGVPDVRMATARGFRSRRLWCSNFREGGGRGRLGCAGGC